jgi:group I intron endonuclease
MPYKYKLCGIYCITNLVDGRQYVGQSVDIRGRKNSHKHDAKRGKEAPVQRAIREHGWVNFSFEILEQCLKPSLEERERFHIESKGSRFPNGYNVGAFAGAPTREILAAIPDEYRGSVAQYLREKNNKLKRESDSEFDQEYRASRSRASRKNWDTVSSEDAAKRNANAVSTFKERMKNPEYAVTVRENRRRANALSISARRANKEMRNAKVS